jgi:hypothetical protein
MDIISDLSVVFNKHSKNYIISDLRVVFNKDSKNYIISDLHDSSRFPRIGC